MQNIIATFAEQYGLTRNEVMAEIENVFSTVRWEGKNRLKSLMILGAF